MPFLCELENTSILRQGIQNLPWMDRLVRTEKAAVARARGGLGLVHVVDVDPQKFGVFLMGNDLGKSYRIWRFFLMGTSCINGGIFPAMFDCQRNVSDFTAHQTTIRKTTLWDLNVFLLKSCCFSKLQENWTFRYRGHRLRSFAGHQWWPRGLEFRYTSHQPPRATGGAMHSTRRTWRTSFVSAFPWWFSCSSDQMKCAAKPNAINLQFGDGLCHPKLW